MRNKRGNILAVAISVLAVLALAIVGYFFWKSKQVPAGPLTWEECLKQPNAVVQLSYPGTCHLPDGRSATQPLSDEEKKNLQPPDETAGWLTYTNTVQKYSFKYASIWKLDQSQASQDPNSVLQLTRDKAKFSVYANMIGIGGVGQDYEGVPTKVGDITLYQYSIVGADDETQILGVTDTLKESLGIFQRKGKTYSVSLSYPVTYNQNEKGPALQKEFDQILSTFKFDDAAKAQYTCPASGWVDCQPTINGGIKAECTTEAIEWFKANCPGFKGAAY